ncbi:GNAT family N-acetyltransferase [Caldicoprobacter algeriensis]|uniref:GNAT family N-acetyltransferase n=1 Tax=Caldicoprobacter algeriensis TaxID=699281 RepID=UPI0020794521|nr:GNAT family N-acetyltransferase [Caldicoprobacter algeriensis]MCM8899647.1 GNAT family N-acetyltransferase [Caldicoprobacter algeriensis]
MVEIKEVKTRKDLKKFVYFPYKLYAGNKYWVPPLVMDEMNTLRQDKNPAFEYCEARYWLALKDGEVVGRIAGIINYKYIEKWEQKNARFGWIDFIDDPEVSKALLATVEGWAREKGMTGLHGPLGFCDLDREGMLVEGFDEMGTFTTIYNYPYYPVHLENNGYVKDVDWLEYELEVPLQLPEVIQRASQDALRRFNLKVLDAKRPKDFIPYVKGIFNLLNEAYKDLYGVVPLTDKQIELYTKQYFGFVNPDYVKVILDQNGEVVAFGIAFPSLTQAMRKTSGKLLPFGFIHILKALKKNDTIDLCLVAVKPELQGKGVNAILMSEIHKACIRNGIVKAECNPQLESNVKVRSQWRYFNFRQHKRRRCYIKYL